MKLDDVLPERYRLLAPVLQKLVQCWCNDDPVPMITFKDTGIWFKGFYIFIRSPKFNINQTIFTVLDDDSTYIKSKKIPYYNPEEFEQDLFLLSTIYNEEELGTIYICSVLYDLKIYLKKYFYIDIEVLNNFYSAVQSTLWCRSITDEIR